MNKLYTIFGISILALAMSLSSWAANPCRDIAKACMQDGFYKGGNKENKGLFENCMLPVVGKTKTLTNATFTDDQLNQCKVMLQEKMKAHQANKS